jgi:hypothetical protein
MMRVQSSEQSYPHSARDVAVVLQYRTEGTYILRVVADGQINSGRKSTCGFLKNFFRKFLRVLVCGWIFQNSNYFQFVFS